MNYKNFAKILFAAACVGGTGWRAFVGHRCSLVRGCVGVQPSPVGRTRYGTLDDWRAAISSRRANPPSQRMFMQIGA